MSTRNDPPRLSVCDSTSTAVPGLYQCGCIASPASAACTRAVAGPQPGRWQRRDASLRVHTQSITVAPCVRARTLLSNPAKRDCSVAASDVFKHDPKANDNAFLRPQFFSRGLYSPGIAPVFNKSGQNLRVTAPGLKRSHPKQSYNNKAKQLARRTCIFRSPMVSVSLKSPLYLFITSSRKDSAQL